MIIKKLIWDEWNINHIAKHNISQEEVEEVCQTKNLFERGRDGIYQITGQSQTVFILLQLGRLMIRKEKDLRRNYKQSL